jgi:hypothetical protein
MKTHLRFVFILLLFQYPVMLIAQKDSISFINEFGISVNQTGISTADGNGYGYSFSVLHSGSEKKHVSWLYGIEFNSANIYTDYIRLNRWYSYSNLSISVQSISIPLLIRVGFTSDKNKLKLFGEGGVRFDYKIWTHMKGTYDFDSGYPDVAPPTSTSIEGYADKITTPFTILPSVGFGISYRLNKVNLILKTDYRFGFGFLIFNSWDIGDVNFFNLSFQVRLNGK